MQYNADCDEPRRQLAEEEDGMEFSEITLTELQEHIAAENEKLANSREQRFSGQDIIVRMDYKYSPNLTIIDTPGKAPYRLLNEM